MMLEVAPCTYLWQNTEILPITGGLHFTTQSLYCWHSLGCTKGRHTIAWEKQEYSSDMLCCVSIIESEICITNFILS